MTKIVYIPLDERPCNYYFPAALSEGTGFTMAAPPLSMMGAKKQPANTEQLWEWLLSEVKDAAGAVISLDTLVYGGIIPSRLHDLSTEQCLDKLNRLQKLKEANPSLRLYALSLIMRCPQYSSDDEEPDYYKDWGREIFRQGYIGHRQQLGIATEEEKLEKADIDDKLPLSVLNDYLHRRRINIEINKQAVKLVQDGTIDFMIVPQDDSAPFGLTTLDQQQVREAIAEAKLDLKIYMYPGADEVGCTLLARMINHFKGQRPLVYPRFSSLQGPFITPLYEDRPLYESVKYQILAAGGLICSSISEADLVLFINSPGETMMESVSQNHPNVGYQVFRNLAELVEMADFCAGELGKPCIVADIGFANGSDKNLVELLRQKKLLFRLAGYAGWNTSSNTLGTCIAQGMIYHIYGETEQHLNFLSLRYTEDAGYCSYVRQYIKEHKLPMLGMDYFRVDGQRGKAAEAVKEELERFVETHINDETYRVVIEDVYMPWSRMFEVGLRTKLQKKERDREIEGLA
ncbi:DUF4127 family protein [Paenibacillus caui]|uniref:DUF4127 family protein n=1 Tax=Paenibacillus caui TaxID=2873927 RepID=UPI001F2DA4C4|nr:DUF4127 family protein [Paenibacillus caui]